MQIVNDENFDNEVLTHDQPVLVYFSAPWCGPCTRQLPIIEKLEENNKIKVFKVDIDESPGVTREYSIRGIPALVLIKGGKEIASKSGLMSNDQLVKWINQ